MTTYRRVLVWLMAAGLVCLVFLAFWPVEPHLFVGYDDPAYLADNPEVEAGLTLRGVRWAFTSVVVANWAPVTMLSHQAAVSFFGLEANAHYLLNVALHALAATILFLVLRSMTGACWRSFLVAALFAVHPLHVESVAWISERKDVLSAIFWFLGMAAWVRFVRLSRDSHAPVWRSWRTPAYLLVTACFVLGYMSKAMLVTFPLALLMIDWWPLGRHRPSAGNGLSGAWRPLVLEKAPLLALSALGVGITVWAQAVGQTISSLGTVPLRLRIPNAVVSSARYLQDMVWPSKLAFFYPFSFRPPSVPVVLVSAAALVAVTVAAIILRRRFPVILAGWCWYLVLLLPVVGLVQIGLQSRADRYTYLPLIGIFVILAWVLPAADRATVRRLVGMGWAALIVLLVILTRRQAATWKDSLTLFGHATAMVRNNWLAENNLGAEHFRQGNTDEAIRHYRRALEIRPEYAKAHNQLGRVLASQGKPEAAESHYRRALAINPAMHEARISLAIALTDMGRTDEALAEYRRVLEVEPGHAKALFGLADTLHGLGRLGESHDAYRRLLALAPDDADAWSNLGNVLAAQDRQGEAHEAYRTALSLNPRSPEAHNNLGTLLYRQGKMAEAEASFREAVRLEPDYPDARMNLGILLQLTGRAAQGITEQAEAARLRHALRAGQRAGTPPGSDSPTAEDERP